MDPEKLVAALDHIKRPSSTEYVGNPGAFLLKSEKEELVRLGSKSEDVSPIVTPKNSKFTAGIGNSQPNIKCKIT